MFAVLTTDETFFTWKESDIPAIIQAQLLCANEPNGIHRLFINPVFFIAHSWKILL